MTVFDVYLNNRKCCRAGVGADGVLTAIVNWVRLTGPAARTARRLRNPVEQSRLHVGGLRHGTHRSWVERNLNVGDRVAIVVAEAAAADRPVRRDPLGATPKPEKPAFLNVDLDIRSASPLDALVAALGPSAFALYVGREGRRYVAHLEAATEARTPDLLIRRLVGLVGRLPRAQRVVWNRAELREFNVGIQAGAFPARYELRLEPATLRAVASVKATIGVTVYGATMKASHPRR